MKIEAGICIALILLVFVALQQRETGNEPESAEVSGSGRDLDSMGKSDGRSEPIPPPMDGDESKSGREWLRASMADPSQDSADQVAWLAALPQTKWAENGAHNFLRTWVGLDSFAAGERMKELPENHRFRETGYKMVREFLIDMGETEAAQEWVIE